MPDIADIPRVAEAPVAEPRLAPARRFMHSATAAGESSLAGQDLIGETIGIEADLLASALALIGDLPELAPPERAALAGIRPSPDRSRVEACHVAIRAGHDPLGAAFVRLRRARDRRALGATYTPPAIVAAMVQSLAPEQAPRRIVDPGAGSGRFLLAAGKRFPDAKLIGVECDPVAAVILRANLAAAGLAGRAQVVLDDYRRAALPAIEGRTLFIGNPPYVRHHGIGLEWKDWFVVTARRYGVKASRLAGLHLHFFLRSLELARAGDLGCFITAAEWLDVNYGVALRTLLTGPLGVTGLDLFDPKALPFEDAVTTGIITHFRVGMAKPVVTLRRIGDIAALQRCDAAAVTRDAMAAAPRWSALLKPRKAGPAGWIALGEICRVHRGQVTGGNAVWIAGPHARDLPERLLHPAITKARELIDAGTVLAEACDLRRVIDIPADLDMLAESERLAVARFLDWARAQGADASYIARHRRAWWSVGLPPPAPILCTYMARRPPAFVRNLCGARHINIAHGLYPREPLSDAALAALTSWLRGHVTQSSGRTYAGGLTKFEPKELERILLPPLEELVTSA
jgi:SAM-dependent methyltransferase